MEELLTTLQARAALYRLLGRIYRVEADGELLEALKAFPVEAQTDFDRFNESAAALVSYVREGNFTSDDLAADYARTFLGAGLQGGGCAYPYESVYTSPEGLVMQDAFEQVQGIMRNHGLASSAHDIPADHIGLELEFMGVLCEEAAEALKKNDEAAVEKSFDEQQQFLQTHLLNWVPGFVADINKTGMTPFYKHAGNLTGAFLEMEKQYFAGN